MSKILLEAIERVGLGGIGYKTTCFRPTAANAAIRTGCEPDMAMYVGRWKTKDVFIIIMFIHFHRKDILMETCLLKD